MSGPLLIQGAMDVETDLLVSALEGAEELRLGGYRFWRGTVGALELVVSRTEVGLVNAACATVLGIREFSPRAVINQGIAGGHSEDLHVGDMVVGESCTHINDLITPVRGRGEGSDPFSWSFHDHSEEGEPMALSADSEWVSHLCAAPYSGGARVVGRLGSGDLFSREQDRILWLQARGGHLCEDMESFAVYRACARLSVPCVGVRILSNNELTGEAYDRAMGRQLQTFLLSTLAQP